MPVKLTGGGVWSPTLITSNQSSFLCHRDAAFIYRVSCCVFFLGDGGQLKFPKELYDKIFYWKNIKRVFKLYKYYLCGFRYKNILKTEWDSFKAVTTNDTISGF